MAVQAQYPSSQDFCSRMNLFDELQMQINGFNNNTPFIINNNNNSGQVLSSNNSELTCIASGSNKRTRTDEMDPNILADRNRLVDSAATSTSGLPMIAHDLVAHLYNQSIDNDASIRLHNERLRLGLEQAQKRHCRALISILEQQVLKKLKAMEMELEMASRRNLELEEKVRQMSAENQIWFSFAKNNEAIVASLKASLEQVLTQNAVNGNGAVTEKEGFGDSDASDAQSCCFEGEARSNGAVKDRRRVCKGCGDKDVSVLLLPCRHLCLCKDCESKADTCPVCHVTKNASLQIFLS